MATDETYNGWTNYETWVVNLWLSNDEGTDADIRQTVAQAIADTHELKAELGLGLDGTQTGLGIAADRIAAYVRDLVYDEYDKAHMVSDLLGSALGRVNWREVAAAFAPEDATA